VLLIRNRRKVTRGRAESRLLRRAQLGVYDLDDGLPWDDGHLPELGRWWKRPFPRSLVARRAASAADRLIVGNEVLAEWGERHCRDVVIVPTCIEPTDYAIRTSWEVGDVPVAGWIGSPATEHYLRRITPALVELNRRTGLRLEVVSGRGSTPPALAPFTTRLIWEPSSTRRIACWDVGLMPLTDGPYERAKCGYKLLQYAASGVPAVGSPVGVNERLLHDMNAPAPTSSDDWFDAVFGLLDEPAERRHSRAEAGFSVAVAHSYDGWQARWLDAVGW
jgi:hypothetical protein